MGVFSNACIIQDVQIPCYFGTYDLDGDGEISPEEFLSATRGFTKMEPKTLFERLDKNGKRIAQGW